MQGPVGGPGLLRPALLVDPVLELLVGGLEVVVDDGLVVHARGAGVLELLLGLGQALLHARLGLGAAAAQALLEDGLGGRGDEDEARGDRGLLDLLDALERWSAADKTQCFVAEGGSE